MRLGSAVKWLQTIPVLLGIVTLMFLLIRLLGDPVEMIAGQRSDAATKSALRKKYHLDQPLIIQYFLYLNQISPVGVSDSNYSILGIPFSESNIFGIKIPDLGNSFQNNRPVTRMIADKFPGSAILAVTAMSFATFAGIILGILSGLYYRKWPDKLLSFGTVLAVTLPTYLLAVILLWVFAVWAYPLTGLNITGYLVQHEILNDKIHLEWKNLVLPALALGLRPLAIIVQLTRNNFLAALGSDYVRTARSKGLSSLTIIRVHMLKNVLNPVVTSVSGWFASLLAGAFFIEYMFDWQGIGKLTLDAVSKGDYPVMLGCTLFVGVVFICMNVLADIVNAQLDPRIKTTG